jgi:thioredoxin-dependent peroxiredoxin
MPGTQAGDPAPSTMLSLHNGERIALANLWARHVVVLFFYPRDDSVVCTKEACAFRDSFEKFVEAGATVVGVSGDSSEKHEGFANRNRLPFLLASDPDGALRKAFGVPKTLGIVPGRVTYVIDRQGIVRHVFSAQFAADAHVREAMEAVRAL